MKFIQFNIKGFKQGFEPEFFSPIGSFRPETVF